MKYFTYDRFDIHAAVNLVYEYYEDKLKIQPSRMRRTVKQALRTIREHASPQMVWKRIPVIPLDIGCAVQKKQYPVKSRKFSRILSRCKEAVICAATLGKALDYELQRDDMRMHERVVLDQTASDVMEAVMDIGQAHIQNQCLPGEAVTKRCSPGYCDWSVDQQQMLFSLLPSEVLGIRLSSSCLMSPRKSVTALMGVADERTVELYGNACGSCTNRDCAFRRDHTETFILGGTHREHSHTSV